MMELDHKEIFLNVFIDEDNTFKVFLEYEFPDIWRFPIVTISDYRHVPWPRKEGNLLW